MQQKIIVPNSLKLIIIIRPIVLKLHKDIKGKHHITHKKEFSGSPVRQELILKSVEFADRMISSSSHRCHRSGGSHQRDENEIFINTFQGKLAEYVVQDTLKSKNIECSEPDNVDYGKHVWDDFDLKVKGRSISVKSMSFFSNLLLLEKKDYNYLGEYRHHQSEDYEFIIVARFKPDIKKLLSRRDKLESLRNRIVKMELEFDIPGVCSKKTIAYIVKRGYILKRGAFIGNNTIMDADNYYIQLGNMPSLGKLLSVFEN